MIRILEKKEPLKIKDIPYLGNARPDAPTMDAWLPRERKEQMDASGNGQEDVCRPAVILIHGGGWTTGDKADEREQNMAALLCEMGYAVFSVNYHMARYEDGPYQGKRIDCAWPECMSDCMDAVSYVRAHAGQYQTDPERICAAGSSAGGHLALLLATAWEEGLMSDNRRYPEMSCHVSGAISLYGVPDIFAWGGELLMPGSCEDMREEWRAASPAEHMACSHPPIMLLHGDKDETVDMIHSIRYYRQLCESGHRAQLMIVRGGKHSFDFSALTPLQLEEVKAFLQLCFGQEKQV